ncbi:MAG: hypothetical protein D6681_17970 [Calditrichaeota bacterium]|nr:MAG: hypothetical protein D6681_17970 [Calditrichota bacterium]
MSFLGVHLNLLIGSTVPVPAPPSLTQALESVEVTHSDDRRSGFQITFQAGRSGPAGAMDYPLLSDPLVRPCNRVVLTVTLNGMPQVLMDGIIAHQQLVPGDQPGSTRMVITGEDVSVMLDREEKPVEHPAQDETMIALKIIAGYAQFGLIPMVIPPPTIDPPLPTERIPVQRATDLEYLQEMAERYGYVFYITPGPAPLTNTAYWGPPVRVGVPQPALSVNLGPVTNVTSINFRNDAAQATRYRARIQDPRTNRDMPVEAVSSLRPPLSSQPAVTTATCGRIRQLPNPAGLNAVQAFARVQGQTDKSADVVTATGEVDTLHYGHLLKPRGLVGLRGVGLTYDGFYYVQQVTYRLERGEFKQSFTLKREGVGTTTPVVIP